MHFYIPNEVGAILRRLTSAGYEAFLAGGCVRDMLMDVPPHDFDIATSAKPSAVTALFADCKVLPIGLKHGTVTVINGEHSVEITSFRKDGKYSDYRHPESVSFSENVMEDAARRDFTVNAMYCGVDGAVLDFYGGESDLKAGLIRAVGKPEERFCEDALRIMRALRFAARLGFKIDAETENAMYQCASLLKNIAAERIMAELVGMFRASGSAAVCCKYLGVFEPLLGKPFKEANSFAVIAEQAESFRLPAFFAMYGGENAVKLLQSLKPDRERIVLTAAAVDAVYGNALSSNATIAQTVSKYGKSVFGNMLSLARSLNLAVAPDADLILAGEYPCSVCELAVNGSELMAIGFKQGKELGDVLKYLYTETYCGLKNEKVALLTAATDYYTAMKG